MDKKVMSDRLRREALADMNAREHWSRQLMRKGDPRGHLLQLSTDPGYANWYAIMRFFKDHVPNAQWGRIATWFNDYLDHWSYEERVLSEDWLNTILDENLVPPPFLQLCTSVEAGVVATEYGLSILSKFPNIRVLHLFQAEIGERDLYILKDLPLIEELSIHQSNAGAIESWPAIKSLKNLHTLIADDALISDISPLAALTKIENLSLSSNEIRSIGPLSQLTNLQVLNLDDSEMIDDIGVLSGATSMQTLSLSGTSVYDITPIRKFLDLKRLELSSVDGLRDVSVLSSLRALTYLRLDDTQVEDLQSVSKLVRLENLAISNTQVRDLSPLHLLSNLKVLDVTGLSVNGLDAIQHLIDCGLIVYGP